MKSYINLLIIALTIFTCSPLLAYEMEAIEEGPTEYSSIWNIIVENTEKVTVKIFETGGGDPALNGNILILNISDKDPEGNSYIWKTKINIRKIDNIELKNNKIILNCYEEFPTQKGPYFYETKLMKYTITYYFDEGNFIKNSIEIDSQEIKKLTNHPGGSK